MLIISSLNYSLELADKKTIYLPINYKVKKQGFKTHNSFILRSKSLLKPPSKGLFLSGKNNKVSLSVCTVAVRTQVDYINITWVEPIK